MSAPADLCDDLRVVVMPGSVAAAFAGRLLDGVGAHVVLVEPPGGDPGRAEPALFAAVHAGMSSRVVDGPADDAVAAADLVLTGPGDVPVERWMAADPTLVVARVTPFGLTGPRAGWASSDLVQLATSLWLHATGDPRREPLAVGGHLPEMVPGLAAASAALMALRARDMSGRGQLVDVSQQESLLLCQPYLDLAFAYAGVERTRNGMPFPMTIVPAADGYLGVNVLTQTQWELLCAYTGHGELLDDPRFASPAERAPHAAELTTLFTAWAADKRRAEVFVEGQGWRVPLGYVPHIDEISAMDQHVARSFFTSVTDPAIGALELPTVPFLVDGARRAATPAPALGAEVAAPAMAPRPQRGGGDLRGGPLCGIRIVDLSMFWSGPLTTGLFAEYGADVVKVESVQRVDGWRGLAGAPGIEASYLYNGVNLNKLGITLDLTSDDGRALLRRLVADADVLVENFSTRVMGNFGLTDEVLLDWNPDLVILSMPAFGMTGPWQDFVGFAPTIEQLSGLPELSGYPDGPPALTGNSIADPCAGLSGCFALLAALHGGRTGVHIDLSQLESLTSLLAPDLVATGIDGSPPPRHGSTSPAVVPQGCYPARGDDRWIVLGAPDDATFTALAAIAGADWAADARFADDAARVANRTALHAAIGAWTAGHDAAVLAGQLQAAGVPAAPVLHPAQLYADEHLAARGSYTTLDRDVVGPARYLGLPFKFSATPGHVERPGPTLGQDNDAVLGGRLGLSPATLADLRAARVIGESIEM